MEVIKTINTGTLEQARKQIAELKAGSLSTCGTSPSVCSETETEIPAPFLRISQTRSPANVHPIAI
jgi:hypothetical protein